jgi:iron complex outermembrane receptor protein
MQYMPQHTRAFKIFLCLVISLFACISARSQNAISGTIADSTKTPIPFCTVALLNAKDSTVVKGNLAGENGDFIFEKIKPGAYIIKCINAGFRPLLSTVITLDSLSKITVDTLILKNDGINLTEVSVSVFKPTVEFKKGVVILNVENNILAGGNTVLELLRRIPGVTIDAQNNISINGRQGVRFLIDGRLQQIPTSQMTTILSGMSADAVSTIELIKNPPAKYDAAGSAGLINIVLKKAKVKGFSGSISQSASQGTQFRSGSTVSLNFKSNKLSVFSNISYYDLQFETNNYLLRRIADTASTFESISRGRQLPHRSILNLSGGLEYEVNKKLILGMNISSSPSNITNTEISQDNIISGNPFDYSYYKFRIDTKQAINNPVLNINSTYKFDTLGTQLQFSADATDYMENYAKYTENDFYNVAGQQAQLPNRVSTSFNNDFKIYTQKLDFTKEFKNTLTLETGVKSSFVNNSSNAVVQLTDSVTRELKKDTNFSNNYRYHERILAGYITLSRTIKKVDLKAGIRTEQTLINADNAPKSFTLHRNYINFFPSTSLDYKISKKHSLQFNYSYRIDRPNYDQLNPTRVYNDQLNYSSGNPRLKPQYSHYLNMEYNYNNFITLGLGYYRTTGFMYYYAYGNPQTKVTIDTIFNYKERNNAVATIFMQKQVKWLNVQLFGMLAYRNFRGQINDLPANSQTFQYYGNFNIEIMLPKNFKVQLNGFYNSRNTDGVQVYYASGSTSIGLLRSFFDKKLDLSLSLYDVFYTERYPNTNSVGGQYSYYTERNDTRRFRLFAIWKFGKMKITKATKQSSDTEKSRLKSVN